MASYTTNAEDNLVYGKINLDRWAAVDNNEEQSTIDARRTWAQELSYAKINARFRDGLYVIPFSPVPDEIKHLSSLLVGILLYDHRRIALQNESKDEVLPHRKMIEKIFSSVLSEQMKLDKAHQSKNYPTVVEIT